MDLCKNCGAPLVEGTPFCGVCGTHVEPQEAPPPQAPIISAELPVISEDPGKTVAWSKPAMPAAPQPLPVHPVPAYRHTEEPPKRVKRSAGTVILSVLLCILMVIPVLLTFLQCTVSGSLNEDTYLQIILDVDLSQLPGSLLNKDLADMDLADAICHEVNTVGLAFSGPDYWKDLTADDLEHLLKETQLPEFAAEQLDRMVKAVLSGRKSLKIRTKDVLDLLYDDLEVLVDDMDLPIDPDALEEAAEEIIHAIDMEEIPLEFDRETNEILTYVRKALSSETLAILLAVMGLLFLLLMLVNLRSPFQGLRDAGIVGIISGILCLSITFLPKALEGLEGIGHLLSVVLSGILASGQLIAAAIVIGGIVLIIGSRVLRKLLKK